MQGFLAFVGFQICLGNAHLVVQFVIGSAVVQAHRVARGAFGRAGVRRWFQLHATRPHLLAAHQGRRPGQIQRQAHDANALQGLERFDGQWFGGCSGVHG